MSRLTRDGTAEPVSRDQILRHARGQGNIHFPCSADHEQDWQPYPVDPYSALCDDHTYIHTYIHTFSQLLEITAKAAGFVIETETADFAHLDVDPFASSKAFVFATGAPAHKGILEKGNQPLKIPNSYKDAVKSPQWKDWQGAIQKEMGSLKQHDVYKLVNTPSVPNPKRENIISSRFVFKQKVDGRFKARLVVHGHVREPGIDYERSYAPVCRIGSIWTLLAIACGHGWPVWQMDVVVAFLQSLIDKDVFVDPTPGHDPRDSTTGEVMVYKLQRSLYGLAKSPVLWYDTIDGVLVVIGFRPTQSDPCVYTHGSGVTLVILTLYVDDILVTGKDPTLVEQKKIELKERFEMTGMGEVSHILGMEVTPTTFWNDSGCRTRTPRTHQDTGQSYEQSSRRTSCSEQRRRNSTSPSQGVCSTSHSALSMTCATRLNSWRGRAASLRRST